MTKKKRLLPKTSENDTNSKSDDNDLSKKDKATPTKRGHSSGLKSVTKKAKQPKAKKAKTLKAKSKGMGVISGSTANVLAIDLTTDNAPSPFSVHDENREREWDSVIIKNYRGVRSYVYKYLKKIQVDDKKVRFCFILYD